MKKRLLKIWTTISSTILFLIIAFSFFGQTQNINEQEVHGAGSGAPTLKLTWDFSTNTTTSNTAFTAALLKTWIETYDAPSISYTINSTATNFKGSGDTNDSYPDGSWKWSSPGAGGSVNISGLPSYTLVKVWAYQWLKDSPTLAINGGTAQTISGQAFNLYTFDGFDNQTSFTVVTVKKGRLLIQKIEFWGC